jgi:hypothetical protein
VTDGNDAQLVLTLDEEEYRQAFGQMGDRDAFIRTLYLFSVSAVGAISWGVISLYLDHRQVTERMIWWMMYLPALACLPLLSVMVAQRRDLVRAGAYIRVFFEDRVGRKGWQGRKGQFTIGMKGESNDPIIWFYYVVLIGCVIVNRALNVPFSFREGMLAVVVGSGLVWGHRKFCSAAKTFPEDCVREWARVLKKESL